MSLPELLESALDGESSVAQVQLGGEDVLVVTPTRTVVYRADGLLSDESIETYDHNAERIDLSVGRRKAKITLDYGLDGTDTLAFPAKRVEGVLHPLLAGVINAAGITDPGETVHKTFRFNDLTLIVTSDRVIKHIGSAVWDEDFEAFEYSGLTDVDSEKGSVATSIVLTHNGRQNRFKTPNEDARAVREAIVEAVCTFHDVTSIEELREAMADQEDADGDGEPVDRLDFGDGPDPLSAEPGEVESQPENATQAETNPTADDLAAAVESAAEDQQIDASQQTSESQQTEPDQPADIEATSQQSTQPPTEDTQTPADTPTQPAGEPAATDTQPTDAFEGSPFESAGTVDEEDISAQLAVLTDTIEQQQQQLNEQQQQLNRQAQLIETLIEELRRGR